MEDGWEIVASCEAVSREKTVEQDFVFVDHTNDAASSTFGTMGKGQRVLELGKEATLFDYHPQDLGEWKCLTHFWFGGNFLGVESTRIRYYIDDEVIPSIDMELYMGHGIGFGSNDGSPWVTKYMGKVGKKNGIFNNYCVPFHRRVRVTAERVSGDERDVPQSWWILRGTRKLRLTLAGVALPPFARLHLATRRSYTAKPLEEFDLLNLPNGEGVLFQVAIAAQSTSLAYLEACIRAYLQPGQSPVMLSSGLEDYFLGTYYFDSGPYHSDIAGLTHLDRSTASFSAYRFHADQDPVFFDNGLRLTCRCGETEHGSKRGAAYLNPQPTTYTTYVWYYQWS